MIKLKCTKCGAEKEVSDYSLLADAIMQKDRNCCGEKMMIVETPRIKPPKPKRGER